MNRLYIKSHDTAQKTMEGLYKDLERRIIASPPGQCPVDLTASFLRLCHSQSCGKCVPCRVGLGQLQHIIDDIVDIDNETEMDKLKLLERTAEAISVSADCAIGTEAANMVLRGLKGYREDFESHILNHTCTDRIRNQAQPGSLRGDVSRRRGCTGLCGASQKRKIFGCGKTDSKGQSVPNGMRTDMRTSMRTEMQENAYRRTG